ncbi:MAG TPA: ABC transporter permease [Gemmatimonadaceae bacterium]|nr:ABC transporter permease [Gemmatimonadaceae bacterium]
MDTLVHDIRYAARKLARTPGFTLVAIVTLALAIGATTAVFSIVNGVILNPLGFRQPDRLVYIGSTSPDGKPMNASPQDLLDYGARNHTLTDLAAIDPGESANLVRASASPLRISEARVGASFFDILGLRAQLGRTFVHGEDAKDAAPVVVLSDAAWRRDFGGDPRIVGQQITLDEKSYTVIGIAPAKFTFPASPDVWVPVVWRSYEIGDAARGFHVVNGIARLRDGATVAGARRDLQSIAAALARDFPKHDAKIGAFVQPLRDQIIGDVERPLWAMFGAVALVLIIACANVANLLLVRAMSRGSEVAVRTALGAGRRRLLQQFVTESVLLAVVGAGLGVLLATWAVDAVVAFGPQRLARLQEISVDHRVLAFTCLLAALTGIVIGVLPGLQLSRWDAAALLRSGTRGTTAGGQRTRSALVFVELALGTVLLVGAGLFIHSFERLTHVDPGFRPQHLIVFNAALSGKKYEYDAGTNAFVDELEARLSSIPGVQSVAASGDRPFDPSPIFEASTSFTEDGAPKPAPGTEPESRIIPASPSFFETTGMRLEQGRTFTEAENRRDAAPVVVINEALAKRYFPGQNPIGKHLTFGISHTASADPADSVRARGEVIGIVRDVHLSSLGDPPVPAAYFPYRTMPFGATFLVRTSGDPASIERSIQAQVAAVDKTVPIYELGTMDAALSDSVSQPRFYVTLFTAFSVVALLLAALGIYGVISYAVSQRAREFGIRLALGATSRDVTHLVVRSGLWLTVGGLVAGALAATFATRVVQSLLFGIAPLDPLAFVAACVALGGTAIAASWLPARRAARTDPAVTMRAE